VVNQTSQGKAKKAVIMTAADSVAIALDDLAPGDRVKIRSLLQEVVGELEVSDSVPYGHKLSLKPIAKGSEVIKDGEVIGIASQSISRGEHVHIHNIVSLYVPPPRTKALKARREP
jgi:altronate dehydratase